MPRTYVRLNSVPQQLGELYAAGLAHESGLTPIELVLLTERTEPERQCSTPPPARVRAS